jgi:hypothetical protein
LEGKRWKKKQMMNKWTVGRNAPSNLLLRPFLFPLVQRPRYLPATTNHRPQQKQKLDIVVVGNLNENNVAAPKVVHLVIRVGRKIGNFV